MVLLGCSPVVGCGLKNCRLEELYSRLGLDWSGGLLESVCGQNLCPPGFKTLRLA